MATSIDKPAADYERDLHAWALDNAALLRAGRLSEIDAQHIAEELEDMGKSQRHALGSHLKVLLTHLLKWRYQPAFRGVSWQLSIDNARDEIAELLDESPSLRGRLAEILAKRYPAARQRAVRETGLPERSFPAQCPFGIEEVLDDAFWPDGDA
jgi:hypothetical protein